MEGNNATRKTMQITLISAAFQNRPEKKVLIIQNLDFSTTLRDGG
jgi:hypothetical protein